MSLSKVLTGTNLGMDVHLIEVEVDISPGMRALTMVGLPDTGVKESRERIKSGILNSEYEFPKGRITVNLAPADIPKEGASFDLPVSIAILAAGGYIDKDKLNDYVIVGEMSLSGNLRPSRGLLPITMALKKSGLKGIIVPKKNILEAGLVRDVEVIGVKNLVECAAFLNGKKSIEPFSINPEDFFETPVITETDFSDIKGQDQAKRAMEVAAAGGHNILMIGPPGSGKTLLARSLPGILPNMTLSEAMETTRIHSVAGLTTRTKQPLINSRPFRSPHHTTSYAGLVGGGRIPMPGEISLAHNGVLFLDELPEFSKSVLETLRQPLEDGFITVSRAVASSRFPARVMLAAAMNPCPCGYAFSQTRSCKCPATKIQNYISKISGPLLDRIDIHIEVPEVPVRKLTELPEGESSGTIRKRVNDARKIQSKRFEGTNTHANAQIRSKGLKKYCKIGKEEKKIMIEAIERLGISARAHDKILRVARTIADLENSPEIKEYHLMEAIQYRSLDRNIWMF